MLFNRAKTVDYFLLKLLLISSRRAMKLGWESELFSLCVINHRQSRCQWVGVSRVCGREGGGFTLWVLVGLRGMVTAEPDSWTVGGDTCRASQRGSWVTGGTAPHWLLGPGPWWLQNMEPSQRWVLLCPLAWRTDPTKVNINLSVCGQRCIWVPGEPSETLGIFLIDDKKIFCWGQKGESYKIQQEV